MLVVAPQPFFSPRGTPFSVYYRTLITQELGFATDVLTYGQGEDVDIPNCRLIRIPGFRWLGRVRTGPSAFKLFLDAFMMLWTVGLLLRHRYAVVHAHEEAVFWCRWLKPLFRFRLVYDMHSSLPQQLHNFQYTRSRWVHRCFERMERKAVRDAEAVIVICPALLDYARSLTRQHDKIFLIENSVFDPVRLKDIGDPRAGLPPEPRVDQGLERWRDGRSPGRILAYAGTLEAYQGIDRLLTAFARVIRRLPDAGLLVIGGQPEQVAACRQAARDLGLRDEVFFTGQVSQSEAQRLVAGAAASVSPRASGDNTPLKIYQLMASGVPLVATRIHSHTQVLDDRLATLTGIDADEMAEGICRVLSDPQFAREKALAAQSWYQKHYSREVYTEKMRELLARVVERRAESPA